MNAKLRRPLALSAFVLSLSSSGWLRAAVLYEQDFEGESLATLDYSHFGMNYSVAHYSREITQSGGANNSQGYRYSFDSTSRTRSFALSFAHLFGVPATDASPLAGKQFIDPSQLRFSVEIKSIGNLSSTPIRLAVEQTDRAYEADRGIDANFDGDMTDQAEVFESMFSPTIANGAEFVTASFTLDQGTLSAAVVPSPGKPLPAPITPAIDPTVPITWAIYFDSAGYGFDAGNEITFDNIRIEYIPEPSTLALGSLALLSLAALRRRKQPRRATGK